MLRRLSLASCACAALTVCPGPVVAQERPFIDAVFELTAALEGTFGDEGAWVGPALDRMERALAQWDRRIRTAERHVARALTRGSPDDACDRRMALARMYAERGRRADAIRELAAACGREPRRADVLVLRGMILTAASDAIAASEAFRAAWRLAPDDPDIQYLAVRYASPAPTAEEIARARAVLTAAYRKLLDEPARPPARPFVALSLLQQRSADAPVLPLARYADGYARLAAGDYDAALAELRRAAATDPLVTDPAARTPAISRAIAALRDGRVAEARSLVERSNPPLDSSEAHRIRGLIDWANADYDRSVERLTIAIDRNRHDERLHLTRARVLSSAGRHAAVTAHSRTPRRSPAFVIAATGWGPAPATTITTAGSISS